MKSQPDAQRRTNALGRSEPFATQWRGELLLGLLAYLVYERVVLFVIVIVSRFSPITLIHYGVLVNDGPAALLLLAMFMAHKWCCFPDIRFVGNIRAGFVFRGILAVTAIYLATEGAALWFQIPREHYMKTLYDFKTPIQIAVMLMSLLILVPIAEELAFRHFLFSVLPFKKNKWIAYAAIIGTAACFSFRHPQYINWLTYVQMFMLGVIFALARIQSNGVVLSFGLHAYAVICALVCDQVVKWLQV